MFKGQCHRRDSKRILAVLVGLQHCFIAPDEVVNVFYVLLYGMQACNALSIVWSFQVCNAFSNVCSSCRISSGIGMK
jgi:hypothetical protein